MENRPVKRKKNVTNNGKGVSKRGEGLGSGKVGSGGFSSSFSKKDFKENSGYGNSTGGKRSKSSLGIIIAIIIALCGGGGLTGLFSGDSTYTTTNTQSWSDESNTQDLDTSVSSSARDKRTVIKGGGDDIITIMVYMCGTDLESRSAMATKDIQEMLAANLSDNINLIIYTGGCSKWQNNTISSSTNQIYKIEDGKLKLLEDDLGNLAMTKPSTLSNFIKWGKENYPADRYDLIFWDHGGGSASGYGYDEKFASSGSMTLAGINTALKDGGVSFDFVGFDACLMATLETALMLDSYSDYLIASEETEPGVGWYYTTWLNELSKNTSMDTLSIGKSIIDSYTSTCQSTCPGQKTTLSLIDLAELSQTVPTDLASFSKDMSELIQNDEYKQVSDARSSTREFATSSKIDQIDLVDFANKLGTEEGEKLADTLKSAIKYNATSSNMTNAYGLSIYFPYKKVSKVDGMVDTYEEIGMDDEYSKCIQEFAALEVSGQVVAGGSSQNSPLQGLFGELSQSSSTNSAELITQMLTTFMSSDFSSISGLSSSNTNFLSQYLDIDRAASYIEENNFDSSNLVWTTNSDGESVISLSEDQWSLVENIDMNMFYDDGNGYIDLGLDNAYEMDDDGNLLKESDKTWLSIEGNVVAYYHLDTVGDSDDYTITGRVPAYLNGDRVDLIIVFDFDNEDGYIAGANYNYEDETTLTVAKNLTELEIGDEIDFICDYYSYDKEYSDSYYLGDTLTVDKEMSNMQISNTYVGDGNILVSYVFTDIYGQNYWTVADES